jgi:hypothetical protein
MRYLTLTLGLLLPLALPSWADDQPGPDPADLQKKLSELEERIATLQREAAELRMQLDKLTSHKVVILTPQEAVDAYKKNPNQSVTVEFGVEPGSARIRTGFGHEDAIWAIWDGQLSGGGTFTAILQPRAYMELKIPSKEKGTAGVKPPLGGERTFVGRHVDVNGLRVTGQIRQGSEGFWRGDYYMVVDDPSKVVLFNSIAPRPIPQP